MAEGPEHKEFVKKMYEFICSLIPKDNVKFIVVDNEGIASPEPIFYGVIPDISYNFKDVMVLGEAKSKKDFDRPHSLRQYKAYIETCENNSNAHSIFVLYVHWDAFLSAQTILRKMIPYNSICDYYVVASNGRSCKL